MMKNEREGKGRAKEGVSNEIGRALWGPLDCGWGSKDGGGGLCEEHPWGIREYSPYKLYFQQMLIHKYSLPKDLPCLVLT